MKRTCFINLTLLCAAGVAHADGMPSYPSDSAAETASAEMEAQDKQQAPIRKIKRLPRGDLRYCLELKTSEEIIRCAEKHRKK